MNRIRGLLAVRSGEGRLVALLAAFFAIVETGRGLAEIAGDSLFVTRVGPDSLPYLYVVLGIATLIVALGYGGALGRWPRSRFLAALLGAFGGLLLAERLALAAGAPGILPVVWLTVEVMNTILLTVVWTVAGTILDTRQARRLFPVCTGAAIAGAFGGTLIAGPMAGLLGTENLLPVVAVLLGVAAVLTSATLARFGRPAARGRSRSFVREMRTGYDEVRRSPLLRLVALAYVLFAILFFWVAFPFFRTLRTAFPNEVDFATSLGLLSAGVTAVAFVVSMAIANRVFARFGVATAALLLPLVYVAGFGLWLVQFGVATAIAFRATQQVTQRGVSNSAWSAIFNVVPVERRSQVLAFMDGVPGQVGITISGLLLIAATNLAPTAAFAAGLVAAVGLAVVALLIRRRYGQALLDSLRAGLGEQMLEGGPGLIALGRDPELLTQLRHALGDERAAVRSLAVDLVARLDGASSVSEMSRLLADPDPGVRQAAIRAIGASDPALLIGEAPGLSDDPSAAVRAELAVAIGPLDPSTSNLIVDRLLGSNDPVARIAGLGVVGRIEETDRGRWVTAAATDPSAEVRAAAMTALGAPRSADGVPSGLLTALDDDSALVRGAAARALATRRDAGPALLGVLERGSERAQDATIRVLDGGSAGTNAAVRAWALRQVERAADRRRQAAALRALAAEGGPDAAGNRAALDYLTFLVTRQERQIEERLLVAIAVLGAPEANGPIRRAIHSVDPDVRAQAIEALDSLGDRGLARAVVRLLDAEMPERRSTDDGLASLCADGDAWIRALALRTMADRTASEWRRISGQVADDADPVVRSALAGITTMGGPTVSTTQATLSEIERILVLRGVPLFSRLPPEDLQRIAAAATERLIPAGDTLVREGDAGDELIVLVEGRVRVVQGSGDDERVLRTYQAPDHIGELSVLTERPRVASVIAEAPGVRGLVIEGEGLRVILRERPDAAMAMLRTLAERIGAQ